MKIGSNMDPEWGSMLGCLGQHVVTLTIMSTMWINAFQVHGWGLLVSCSHLEHHVNNNNVDECFGDN